MADEVVTWDQYVRRTASAIGAPEPRIVHIPTDFLLAIDKKRYGGLDEIFQYHGVYSNAKLKLDVPQYRLEIPYEEGVRRTVEWMDKHGKCAKPEPEELEDRIVAAWDKFSKDAIATLGAKQ